MPIAKLVSADGPIRIYYELHGRVTTNRDDFSYSKAAGTRMDHRREPSSLDSASETDVELGRVKGAIDSAAVADRRVDTGKKIVNDNQQSRVEHSTGVNGKPGSIEMTDMSGKARNVQSCARAIDMADNNRMADEGSPAANTLDVNSVSAATPEDAAAADRGFREGQHIIQMPHEDAADASSRCMVSSNATL